MKYWLMKSEKSTYSWADLVKDKVEEWNGVRNYQARNNMREMKVGDKVLFYHSVNDKEIVGIASVANLAHPDSTDKTGVWECVDIKAEKELQRPVLLSEVKENKKLKDMVLVKNSRLSVQPVLKEEFNEILKMSKLKI